MIYAFSEMSLDLDELYSVRYECCPVRNQLCPGRDKLRSVRAKMS